MIWLVVRVLRGLCVSSSSALTALRTRAAVRCTVLSEWCRIGLVGGLVSTCLTVTCSIDSGACSLRSILCAKVRLWATKLWAWLSSDLKWCVRLLTLLLCVVVVSDFGRCVGSSVVILVVSRLSGVSTWCVSY